MEDMVNLAYHECFVELGNADTKKLDEVESLKDLENMEYFAGCCWSICRNPQELNEPPFIGGNREKMQKKIVKDKVKLPGFLSSDAHSLLKGLLQKEAGRRLGSGPGGSEEIKRHKWFKSINWKKLDAREVHPSFIPEVGGIHCTSNFDERWTNMSLLDSPASSPTAAEVNFTGFTYVRAAASFLRSDSSC